MRPIHGLWVVLAIVAALVVGLLLVGRQPLGSGVAPALPAESLARTGEDPRPAAELADVEPDGAAAVRAPSTTMTVGSVRPDPQAVAAGTGFRLRGRIVSA